MAATQDAMGAAVTVFFDWATAGYAAPSQEIANLVWSNFLKFKLDVQEAARLEAAVFCSSLRITLDAVLKSSVRADGQMAAGQHPIQLPSNPLHPQSPRRC